MLKLNRIEFFFEDEVVGYFDEDPPLAAGEHRYMPYRGPGHLHLIEALRSGPQRCYFGNGDQTQVFIVRRALGIHLLEIGR